MADTLFLSLADMFRSQPRIGKNKSLPVSQISKRVSYANRKFLEPFIVKVQESATTCSLFGEDVMSAIKRKMKMCNALFLEPDGDGKEENEKYSYHSKILARVIVLFTKDFWPGGVRREAGGRWAGDGVAAQNPGRYGPDRVKGFVVVVVSR